MGTNPTAPITEPAADAPTRFDSMGEADLKELFGYFMGGVGKLSALDVAHRYETDILKNNGLNPTELTDRLAELNSDHAKASELYNNELSEVKTAFQEALQASGKSPEDAAAMTERVHTLLKSTIGNPDSGKSFSETFDYVMQEVDGLDLQLSDNERADLDEKYEASLKEQLRVKQMLEELKAHQENGSPIFRIFGIGMNLPTKSLSDADMMGAANVFLAKAREDGLVNMSDEQLAEQQAILGVISTVMVQQNSLRSVINIAGHGLAEGTPLVVAGLFEAGKGITQADWKAAIQKADGTELRSQLGDTFEEFTERMNSAGQQVDYEVTSQERMRITRELWHVLQDPNGAVMIHGTGLDQKYIDMLPESVKTKLYANAANNGHGDNPTLLDLAQLRDPQLAKLATMWTGAFAKADAQANTRAYDMNYHYTEDGHGMNAWTAMGGQPAANMLKYAIAKNSTTPSVNYYDDKIGNHEPERKGELDPTGTELRKAGVTTGDDNEFAGLNNLPRLPAGIQLG